MKSEQNQQIKKMVAERFKKDRTIFILFVSFFVGVVDEIGAWRKHDVRDAITVAIIWFLLGPLLLIGFIKLIGPLDD